jgi:hypothetical protein
MRANPSSFFKNSIPSELVAIADAALADNVAEATQQIASMAQRINDTTFLSFTIVSFR